MVSQIDTEFTRMFGCRYPLIGAPMFLVSNVPLVTAVSKAGGLGCFPSLNCRSTEEFEEWVEKIRAEIGDLPYGVNLILHKSNQERLATDLEVVLKNKIPLIISSLGDPTEMIKEAHKNGIKVFCDVINDKHAKKAVDAGADGLVVVGSGAGGHAGPLSPFAAIPWFKEQYKVPVVAAGAIASGKVMASALALGAEGVSVGTRFIASSEAAADQDYKEAVVKAEPGDIFLTPALSGVNASIIKTKETQEFYEWERSFRGKASLWFMSKLMKRGLKLKRKYSWKNVWSAGQSVGQVTSIESSQKIIEDFVLEYFETLKKLGPQ